MKKITGIVLFVTAIFAFVATSAFALTISNKCPWFTSINGICKYKIDSINVGILETDTNTSQGVVNFPLSQPEISGATMEPGNAITVSWTPELKSTDFDHYFVRYGCAATPDVQVETGTITNNTKDNYVWWTIPNNLGNNCYCKVWVTIKQGADNYNSVNWGGANSRPFYVCKNQPVTNQVDPDEDVKYIKGQILVQFKPAIDVKTVIGQTKAATFAKQYNLSVIEYIPEYNTALLQTTANETVKTIKTKLANHADTAVVQPNYIYQPNVIPNDLGYSKQWALPKMKAPEAWDKFTGTKDVIVAVTDTGVYYDHPDLKDNMWDGSSCKAPDGSGKCPNHGWDFGSNDNDPKPNKGILHPNEDPDGGGHGTHVAGIVGAVGNNSVGVAGSNWKVSLMAVKMCKNVVKEKKKGPDKGKEEDICEMSTIAFIKGIDFAKDNKAKIINASLGATVGKNEVDILEKQAIERFTAAGGLFVVAAGNEGFDINNNASTTIPCSYDTNNLICVASTDENDKLSKWPGGTPEEGIGSNYGNISVDIGAPGSKILSTYWTVTTPDPMYATAWGTSMAAPYVSGLAAFIWGNKPSLTAAEVKKIIIDTADPAPDLQGKTLYPKRINFFNAINGSNTPTTTPPTTTPPLAPMVITEDGLYDTTKNTLDMSATIWVGRQTKEVDWWFKVYVKDTNGAKTNEMELPSPRGKKTIVYPNGEHLVKATAKNLSKLANDLTAWCFTPYAKYSDGSGIEGFGQELCFPKVPWIVTKKPTNVDMTSGKATMNGAITYFANFKKIDTWFEYGFKNDPNVQKTTPKPVNAVNPVPKGGTVFSENITFDPKKSDPFCYKACGKGQGGKFNTCGAQECLSTSTSPTTTIKVETLVFGTNASTTVYKGKITPVFTTASCEFRIFPKSDSNETSNVVKQAGPPNPLTGIFEAKDTSLDFKNSKYCYRAYCTVQGNTYKAENKVCAEDGGGGGGSTSNLFLLACGSVDTCAPCRTLDKDMKKYAQEKGITMLDDVKDSDFQSKVLGNKEKIKLGHMEVSENSSCNSYFSKYSPQGGIPMGVFFRDGKDIDGFAGYGGDYDSLKNRIEGLKTTNCVSCLEPMPVGQTVDMASTDRTMEPYGATGAKQYYYPTPGGWCNLTTKKYNSTSSCSSDLTVNPNLRANNGYPLCFNNSDVCGGVAFACMKDISQCKPKVRTDGVDWVEAVSAGVKGTVTSGGKDIEGIKSWVNVRKVYGYDNLGSVKSSGPWPDGINRSNSRKIEQLDPGSQYVYAFCASNAFGGVCDTYKYDPELKTKSYDKLFIGTMGISQITKSSAYLSGRLYNTYKPPLAESAAADVWFLVWQPKYPGACFPENIEDIIPGSKKDNIGLTTIYTHRNYSTRDDIDIWADYSATVTNLKPNTDYCYESIARQLTERSDGISHPDIYKYDFGVSYPFKTLTK